LGAKLSKFLENSKGANRKAFLIQSQGRIEATNGESLIMMARGDRGCEELARRVKDITFDCRDVTDS
jgi:hypothetical protein